MNRLTKTLALPALLVLASGLQGCIGFSGPNHVRNAIAKQQDVKLDKEMGVDVGPVGVALVNTFASAYSPVTLDGLWSVSFGEYHIRPGADGTIDHFRLDDVELKDWEPFVRVREHGSTLKLMHNARGDTVNKMLFLNQEGSELTIVQAEGNFNKIIDNVLNSELVEDVEFLRHLEETAEPNGDMLAYDPVRDGDAPPTGPHVSPFAGSGYWW